MIFKAVILFSVLLCALPALSQTVVNNNPSQAGLDANDNNVLRFALTLESLEANFYATFNARFTAADFRAAGYPDSVYNNFVLIANQEAAHVTLLNDTLIQRTGAGLQACVYNFSAITNVTQYVGAARLFENVGTFAYDGAIDSIYNRTLQTAAATIATVEARHAAYLNRLPGEIAIPGAIAQTNPFPNAQEPALQPPTVAGAISPFLTSCPYDVNAILPVVIAVIPVPAPSASLPQNPTITQVSANDLAALNYALALEYLEATFYNVFMARYTVNDFTSNGLTALDYSYFNLIRAHENAHVTYLQGAISALPAQPGANCTYNFTSVTSFPNFIAVAKLLENTGVSAYDGAVNTIFTPAFREAAATIATVEARHAAYLNQISNTSPFPDIADTATPPSQILSVVSANFIIGACPITVPQSLVVIPYNGTIPANPTSSSSSSSSTTSSSTSTGGAASSTTSSASSVSAVFVLVVLSLAALLW